MELPVVNHPDYVAKINDDNKFPIKKFGALANYLLENKVVQKFYIPKECSVETMKTSHSLKYINDIKNSLPSLPDQIRKNLVDNYGVSEYDASVISEEKEISDYFFLASKGRDGKLVSNWLTTELFGSLNKNNLKIEDSPISPEQLGELVDFISDGTISGRIAKDVFAEMFETKKNPSKVIDEKGLKQISSSDDLIPMIEKVISNNLDKVDEYKNGKEQLFGFFVGQVMKESSGKANPKLVNQLLKQKLN